MPKRKPRLPTDRELQKMPVQDLPWVRIEWVDSCAIRFWRSRKEMREQTLSTVITTGQLLKRGKKEYIVVNSFTSRGSFGDGNVIATVLIRKVEIKGGGWVECQKK